MTEYEDILRFLASNPPRLAAEKKIHASLLEMLARKLKGEKINFDGEVLNGRINAPSSTKRLH